MERQTLKLKPLPNSLRCLICGKEIKKYYWLQSETVLCLKCFDTKVLSLTDKAKNWFKKLFRSKNEKENE